MYKYNIHPKLRQLTLDDYQIAMKWLPVQLKISYSTWKQWIYIKHNDTREVPVYALQIMANFFQCDINEMFNEKASPLNYRQLFLNFKDL